MALTEHLKLSILVGRVLKTIYSPTGLKHATDEQLETLLADMDSWLVNLPEELQYKGPQSSHMAGTSHYSGCSKRIPPEPNRVLVLLLADSQPQDCSIWVIAHSNSYSGEYSCG